jgi:AMP deaminase
VAKRPDADVLLPVGRLLQIVGFDCVDDESKPEMHPNQGVQFPKPAGWTAKQDPPYSYWCYYIYANIKALNDYRATRGAGRAMT